MAGRKTKTAISIAQTTEPTDLAKLMRAASTDADIWRPEELEAVLLHQLDSPLESGLADDDPQWIEMISAMSASEIRAWGRWRDVLLHSHPPVELLEVAKRFAKSKRSNRDASLPTEVATILYYACIAAAMARCGKRITALHDAELQDGFEWAIAQAWVCDDLRTLFREGANALHKQRVNH